MKYCFKLLCILILTVPANDLFCQDTIRTVSDSTITHDKHPQDLPEDIGFYIRSTDKKSYLRLYGSIRLNGAYDKGGLKTKQTFSTYDIPTDIKDNESRFFMSPYQSRLGVDVKIITFVGPVNLKLESDFLGAGNSFRIRHAYGTIGDFLFGQTWSVFGDPTSIPNTVDQDGPNSSLSERTIQVRYEPKKSLLNWTIAIESPNPDITNPDSLEIDPVFQSFPDITGRVKFTFSSGYIRLGGIFRSITVRNIDNSLKVLAGYGGLFSTSLNLSRMITLKSQISIGKGISRYITGLTGKGQDVIFDPIDKNNQLLFSFGGFVSASYQFKKHLTSAITLGMIRIRNQDFQSGNSFKSSFYTSLNAFYKILESSEIGAEYSFGKRINKDRTNGNANRISFIGFINF